MSAASDPGVTPGDTPDRAPGTVECLECQEIDLAEAVARGEMDASRETDCRVLRRRHQDAEHGGRT
ncbi:hypothetical protein ACFVW8_01090 [Streptomyces sp. NPDC058221]|uniref:hypothetical protein n=1 Tax=Streptomyces sp. NPDC058221 TaxID=3346388 RepID=UPI0036E62A5C